MGKCLLDILEEERSLVRDINILSDRIKIISDRRVELLMSFTSDKEYEYERHYLAHLQDDIDRNNAEKLKLQAKLAVTRRELANYIKYDILKGE